MKKACVLFPQMFASLLEVDALLQNMAYEVNEASFVHVTPTEFRCFRLNAPSIAEQRCQTA